MRINYLRIIVLSLFTLLLFSCVSTASKDSPRVRYIVELLDGDNKNMYGCSLLINMEGWKQAEDSESWFRDQSWRYNNGITQNEKNEAILSGSNSITFLQDPQKSLIYVGKWHYVKKIGNYIRLISYQRTDSTKPYGKIYHQFESKTKENEKIKEMRFTPTKRIAISSRRSECAIKWYDKYGYNAIAETKRVWARGFWGKLLLKRELVVTGKIINAKE